MQRMARAAIDQLTREGFECALINPRFVKPLDTGTTEFFARTADVLVTMEDHVLQGGYGSAVLEFCFHFGHGVGDGQAVLLPQIIDAGSVDYLREKYGLTVANTVTKVKAEFENRAAIAALKDMVLHRD